MFHSQDKMVPYQSMTGRRWKAGTKLSPNCPRCDSPDTKFCYYNNYSKAQPRYFCKGCRRYWTKGGALRDVPVGGGSRKNRTRGNSAKISSAPICGTHQPPPSSLRPDVALDGMAGSLLTDFSSSDPPAIDLAVIYAKFSNQCPVANAWDSNYQIPGELMDEHRVGTCQRSAEVQPMMTTSDFYVDARGALEPLAWAVEGVGAECGDIFSSLGCEKPQCIEGGFGLVDGDDGVVAHHQILTPINW